MYSLPMSPAAAKKISEMPSEDLIAFLKNNGWREAGPFGAYAVRLLSPEPETGKAVIVPISREIADYEWLMINALIEIAKHNKKQAEYALCDIILHNLPTNVIQKIINPIDEQAVYEAYIKGLEKNGRLLKKQQDDNKYYSDLTYQIYTLTEAMSAGVTMTPRTPNIKTAK